jgi:hypothetical protein
VAAPPIPVYTDNSYYADRKSQDEFALVRLGYGQMHELTVGAMMERISGVLMVEVYTRKGSGPGRAQDAGEAVLVGLASLNGRMEDPMDDVVARTGPINGPAITPLDGLPHVQARLNCQFFARYNGPLSDFGVVLYEDEGPIFMEDE